MNCKTSVIFLTVLLIGVISLAEVEGRINIYDITTKQVFKIAVLKNRRPVIVYFTKPSCGRGICARLQANLEDLARENEQAMDLAIVDLEKRPEFKDEFQITNIPTTRAYFQGNMLGQVKGPIWNSIKAMTDRILNENAV